MRRTAGHLATIEPRDSVARIEKATWALFAVIVAAALPSERARAQQFVLTDVSYTHSATTTTDSHYRVSPADRTPANWTSPVDYTKGSAYVRLRVKTKPSGNARTRFQICFEGTNSYACTSQSPVYTAPGTHEWTTAFSSFYIGNGVAVDWSKGIPKVALILKDDKNVKPAPENVGEATAKLYMPSDLEVMVGIAAAGTQFVPPARDPIPDAGTRDAGTADASRAGADADVSDSGATTPDTARPIAQDASRDAEDVAPEDDAGGAAEDASMTAAIDAGAPEDESSSAAEDDEMAAGREEHEKEESGCQLASSPAHRQLPLGAYVLLVLMGYRCCRRSSDRR